MSNIKRIPHPTGSKEYNEERQRQLDAERERLKGVGNPTSNKRQSIKDSLKELKGMGANSQESKDIQERAKNELLERSKKKREEREQSRSGAGREDLMSKQRQRLIAAREEARRKAAEANGGGSVVKT